MWKNKRWFGVVKQLWCHCLLLRQFPIWLIFKEKCFRVKGLRFENVQGFVYVWEYQSWSTSQHRSQATDTGYQLQSFIELVYARNHAHMNNVYVGHAKEIKHSGNDFYFKIFYVEGINTQDINILNIFFAILFI